MVLALASAETTLWEFALVFGVVVIVAVIALLSLLLSSVGSIEASAVRVGNVARGVADNTANIKIALAVAVADSLDEITDEASRHARLLGVGAQ
ncbi:MAG: hypothetical protein ACRDR6_19415 [Pseudonocardiaceae bacterium]